MLLLACLPARPPAHPPARSPARLPACLPVLYRGPAGSNSDISLTDLKGAGKHTKHPLAIQADTWQEVRLLPPLLLLPSLCRHGAGNE